MTDIFTELERRRNWHIAEFGVEPRRFVLSDHESNAFNLEAGSKAKMEIKQGMRFRSYCGLPIYSESDLARCIEFLEGLT